MRRHRLRIAAAVLGCLAVAFAVWWFFRPTSINRTQYDAITEGMTRAEVFRLLGGPPRNDCPDDVIVWLPRQGKRVSAEYGPSSPSIRVLSGTEEEAVWMSDEGLIAARFDKDGRLCEKYFSTVHGPEGSPLQLAFRRTFGRRAMPVPVKGVASGTPTHPEKPDEAAAATSP